MNTMKVTTASKGVAGEYRVVSELLMRGHHPMLAVVDNGSDIYLETGITIQVKTSYVKDYQGDKYSYAFHFRTTYMQGYKRLKRHKLISDFVICFCVPDQLFYIIPKDVVGEKERIAITPTVTRGSSLYDDYKEAWELLKK